MIHPFLAAEAGGSGTVPLLILIVALIGFAVAYFVVGPGKRSGPRRHADIPLAMRPYHSDEELETTGMERAMSWGVALAVFASLFIPLYWLIEPTRINSAVDDFYEADVAAGRAEYQNACAACHGVNLEGGSAPHPNPEVEAAWPAPALMSAAWATMNWKSTAKKSATWCSNPHRPTTKQKPATWFMTARKTSRRAPTPSA